MAKYGIPQDMPLSTEGTRPGMAKTITETPRLSEDCRNRPS
jgi:hypothetical protein